jgi:hypothetical protein
MVKTCTSIPLICSCPERCAGVHINLRGYDVACRPDLLEPKSHTANAFASSACMGSVVAQSYGVSIMTLGTDNMLAFFLKGKVIKIFFYFFI